MPEFPGGHIDLSVYSPPFSDLYNYSSSECDLSNNKDYETFLCHYLFVIREIARLTKPGRLTCVHCTDIPLKGDKGFSDFPGDIIRLHQKEGFYYTGRRVIWKEPLRMAIRTRAKGLMHRQIVKDSSLSDVASADYLLTFRKSGTNKAPITHEWGLSVYSGEDQPTEDLITKYRDWKDPATNKLSHLIWQRYASCAWYDIRINHVLTYRAARDSEEEKHVCPLQLDVINRAVQLWSNPGDTVFTPFMGVGSEVYGAVSNGRRGIGVELKESYYRQAVINMSNVENKDKQERLL
jgi:DNA modification methylase